MPRAEAVMLLAAPFLLFPPTREFKMRMMNRQADESLLPTTPPMTLDDALSNAAGIYSCIKNRESVFVWVNDNFARLIGKKKEELIGHKDQNQAHVEMDKQVLADGKPRLNLCETISVPTADGQTRDVRIVTQKGPLRKKGSDEIIGITVFFSLEDPAVEYWIDKLGMTPTGLGGLLAPTSVSDDRTLNDALPERFDGDRRFYSANYFMLRQNEVLALHTLNQDELWFFHLGSAVRLHVFDLTKRTYSVVTVGGDFDKGERLQAVAPHNQWFGAELVSPGHALVSCSLAPGFDPRDSRLPTVEQLAELKRTFPQQEAILDRLTGVAPTR